MITNNCILLCTGGKLACKAAREIATSLGARMTMPLSVAGAFHTTYMEPAVAGLREALSSVKINKPRIPVISNVDAKPHYEPDDIREVRIMM